MRRGDIYVVLFDPTIGHEQQGRRPVVIISPDAFNALGMALVVPITTGGSYARTQGFTVSLTSAALNTTGVVLCHQPRVLDMQARGAKWVEALPTMLLDEVLHKLMVLFE